MKTKVQIAAVVLAVSCIIAGLVPDCRGASDVDKAFAMIGAEMSVGNFHLYPPFHNNVIAPHAVVADNRVFSGCTRTTTPLVSAATGTIPGGLSNTRACTRQSTGATNTTSSYAMRKTAS